MERRDLTQRILQLTLNIIYLLTGEDYGPKKKGIADHVTSSSHPCLSGGCRWNHSPTMGPPPPSLTPERNNDKKILEVARQIIELLTGEVPIRCQDVAVYLSMEERDYLEEHREMYKAAMMEEEPPLTSPGKRRQQYGGSPPLIERSRNNVFRQCVFPTVGSRKRNPPETYPRPLYSQDSAQEEHSTLQEDQHKQIMTEASADMEKHMPNFQIKEEEISPQISTDAPCTKNNMETVTFISKDGEYITDFLEEHLLVPDLHPAELSYSPCAQIGWFPDHPPPVFHLDAHPASEMFPCSEHGKYFAGEAELLSHHSGHMVEDLLCRPESGKYFRLYQRDQMKHGREAPFSCSECGKCFAHKLDFLRHKCGQARVKPFSCPKCGKCFSQRSHLLSHERTHVAQRPYSCSICGKCYTQKSSLTTHEKVHIGLKPYICSVCGKCFTRKSLLTLHERVHTGEKPYSCSECGRCFSQRTHLVSHRRTHMAEKPFSCSQCGKCYSRKSYLDDHCRTHTGVKPYPCPTCGKCFSDKTSCRSHQRIHRGKNLF